ncbi:MAG: helix-turn-helix domain-containing protein [Candidatus Nanopelagicaceae bacterium]|nr:helix-turn-helix domain-containing protein [Candidatus Nanopelagicaceae bacterium]
MLSKYRQRQVLNFNLERLKRYLITEPTHGWIKTYRYLFDLSQNDLARLMNVSQKRIDVIEDNEINSRIEIATLIKVAEIFDSELRYLLIPRKPLEEIRESLIHKSLQLKLVSDDLANTAYRKKIDRLRLRGIYGQDPMLF